MTAVKAAEIVFPVAAVAAAAAAAAAIVAKHQSLAFEVTALCY